MKDILNRMTNSIKTTYTELASQSNKTIDQTKYRTELVNEKNKLKKLYQKLGEYTYLIEADHDVQVVSEIESTNEAKIKVIKMITETLEHIQVLEAQVEALVHTQKNSFESYKEGVKTVWKEQSDERSDNKSSEADSEFDKKDSDKGIKILRFCKHCDRGNAINEEYCVHCGKKM